MEYMKLLTGSILRICLIVVFMGYPNMEVRAQATAQHPMEWAAYEKGNALINGEESRQLDNKTGISVSVNSLSYMYDKMEKWEEKYNKYLQKVEGYASTLKASTSIYNDGIKTLMTLNKIREVVNENPEGVLATVSMNNLYIETLAEFITVYTLMKNAVAVGGKKNMLTGAERTKLLWGLESKMRDLNGKLNRLYYSLRSYTLVDVWDKETAGIVRNSRGGIARKRLAKWGDEAKATK